MSVCVVCHFIEMTRLCKVANNLIEFGLQEKTICPDLQAKMTCFERGLIPMVDPERERDAMKQETFGSRFRGSYVLGRSHNRSTNYILRDAKNIEDN